jgi:hypothetical protein
MHLRTAQFTIVIFALSSTIVIFALSSAASHGAQVGAGEMVASNASATFAFTTSVHTPKGSRSGSGTVMVKRTGAREASLTVQSDDGSPARTIPLIVGIDGSVAPDGSAADAAPTDPNAKAKAAAFMSAMTIAAHVGIGARKNGGAGSYSVPAKLTPIGNGTPVATQLAMSGTPAGYTGVTQGQTQTELPQGGGLDPDEIAKAIGVSAFAHRAFGPAGRAATVVVMQRKRREERAAASGLLPDDVRLTVTAQLADGKIKQIRGAQTDSVAIAGKPVRIESTWSFTRTPE